MGTYAFYDVDVLKPVVIGDGPFATESLSEKKWENVINRADVLPNYSLYNLFNYQETSCSLEPIPGGVNKLPEHWGPLDEEWTPYHSPTCKADRYTDLHGIWSLTLKDLMAYDLDTTYTETLFLSLDDHLAYTKYGTRPLSYSRYLPIGKYVDEGAETLAYLKEIGYHDQMSCSGLKFVKTTVKCVVRDSFGEWLNDLIEECKGWAIDERYDEVLITVTME